MRANHDNPFAPFDPAGDQRWLDSMRSGFGYAYALVATADNDRFTARMESGREGLGARVLEALSPAMRTEIGVLVVPDARQDARFATTDMVTGESAFVGLMASLVRSADGTAVGVVVVADPAVRTPTATTIGRMRIVAGMLKREFADIDEATSAHAVQRALLPMHETVPAGYEFDGCSILHGRITGAYFDWLTVSSGIVGLGLTASTGSGVEAGMIAASARGSLRSAAVLGGVWQSDLAGSVARASRALVDDLVAANARVSLLYGALHPRTGEVLFVNAGLEPPLVFRAGGSAPRPVAEYSTATPPNPFGSTDIPFWTTEKLVLEVGDTLVAATASGWAVLAATRTEARTAGAITDAVEAWARAHPEYSGVAMLAITRTSSAADESAALLERH